MKKVRTGVIRYSGHVIKYKITPISRPPFGMLYMRHKNKPWVSKGTVWSTITYNALREHARHYAIFDAQLIKPRYR